MVCINTGEGTRVNTSNATLSCIDVTFASPPIAVKCHWTVLNDTWGSDHCPILIDFNYHLFYQNTSNLTPQWSLKVCLDRAV